MTRENGVLEIGPGIGPLTVRLSGAAAKVVAVELDRALLPVLAETLAGRDNVQVVPGDILKLDLAALVEREFSGLVPMACANLPYNITSPVLTKLIGSGLFDAVTVMIQREVARRICAGPGDGDYGAFSVFAAYHTEPKLLFDVPPSCFMPQPKVHSSVIRMEMRREKAVTVPDESLFFRVVRAAFAQRRKTLLNALSAGFSRELTKQQVEQAISACDLEPAVRGERLNLAEFAALSRQIGGLL